jgi:hypothetical protein
MFFGYFTLFVALLIEVVGAYYSITGLAAIFSGAVIPILIMGGVLEVGKVTAAVWLKNNWHRASVQFKLYLLPAVTLLMFITSMGIFGFLSKAHNDQNLVSGDVLGKIAIYDEKIKIQKDNIESARKALQQMDAAVDQTMARSTSENGADKATAIRRGQARERSNLQGEIARSQTEIVKLNDQRAPIAAEVRKVEAEVGPIKYIAKMIYGDNPDANLLEQAVVWVIMMIVAVFDPLALVLILAAQQSIRWARGENKEESEPRKILTRGEYLKRLKDKFSTKFNKNPQEDSSYTSTVDNLEPVVDQVEVSDEYFRESESKEKLPVVDKKILFGGFGFPLSTHFADKFKTETETVQPVKEENPHALAHIVIPEIADDDPLHKLAKMMYLGGQSGVDEREIHAAHQAGDIDRLPWHDIEHINNLPISDGERKQLIDRFVTSPPTTPTPTFYEIDPLALQADNAPTGITGEVKGFGTSFPGTPNKGDMFLRVDRLPSSLYKFNGNQWIEIDKALSDQHAYNNAYIDHLIEKISTGEYDPELLSDAERESIEQRLKNIQQT